METYNQENHKHFTINFLCSLDRNIKLQTQTLVTLMVLYADKFTTGWCPDAETTSLAADKVSV